MEDADEALARSRDADLVGRPRCTEGGVLARRPVHGLFVELNSETLTGQGGLELG